MSNSLTLNTEKYVNEATSETKSSIKESLNFFQYPQLSSITINVGVGTKYDNKQKTDVASYLTKITAQKPRMIVSKKSIAGFNLRAGNIIGTQVTLRGQKMYDFLINLVYTTLPRSRDFKGIKKSFDKSGKTFSLGLPSTHIFPVIGFDADLDFGMQINIVFKNNSQYNSLLLEKFNFPFSK